MVRKYRAQLGLTQEELAWQADLHRTYLADIERGARNITLRVIAKLAKSLHTTVADFFPPTVYHAEPHRGNSPAPGARKSRDILLVHGDATRGVLTARAFERAMQVNPITIVRDGETGLDYLFATGRYAGRKVPLPQLILVNIVLARMSASEFLRHVKSDRRTSSIPVIILAASQ